MGGTFLRDWAFKERWVALEDLSKRDGMNMTLCGIETALLYFCASVLVFFVSL